MIWLLVALGCTETEPECSGSWPDAIEGSGDGLLRSDGAAGAWLVWAHPSDPSALQVEHRRASGCLFQGRRYVRAQDRIPLSLSQAGGSRTGLVVVTPNEWIGVSDAGPTWVAETDGFVMTSAVAPRSHDDGFDVLFSFPYEPGVIVSIDPAGRVVADPVEVEIDLVPLLVGLRGRQPGWVLSEGPDIRVLDAVGSVTDTFTATGWVTALAGDGDQLAWVTPDDGLTFARPGELPVAAQLDHEVGAISVAAEPDGALVAWERAEGQLSCILVAWLGPDGVLGEPVDVGWGRAPQVVSLGDGQGLVSWTDPDGQWRFAEVRP